jgi:2-polyprenyl-3-methyl-5-hydroxy-6-metoxy-1,4-benzoquinol methylase
VDPPPHPRPRSVTSPATGPGAWRNEVDALCTICRTSGSTTVHVIDGHPIVRCSTCGHLYVSPRPAMEDVVSIYGAHYFENPAFAHADHDAYYGYADYLKERPNIQLRAAQLLNRIEQHQPPGRLLDIGCGMGLFVEVAARRGWDAWGLDINEQAVAWAREHVSEQVRAGMVTDLDASDGLFDCITMFDVIEHVADPREDLQAVWRALRPGGLLVVLTPDAGAVVSRALGSHWLEMKRAPEHLQFFSTAGLARLLRHAGFTPIEWHSAGKIATLRNMLTDLRFYSARFFDGVERVLERLRVAEVVVDMDPRTKLCMYARKDLEPQPIDRYDPSVHAKVPRARDRYLGRAGVRRAHVPPG